MAVLPGRSGLAGAATAIGLRTLKMSDVRERGRLVGETDEARDAGGVLHGAPRLVGELHPDVDVAGVFLLVDRLALAVLDLDDLLGGDLDLEDEVLHVERGDSGLEVGLDLVLVAGVAVHDIPVAVAGPCQLLAEGLDRVEVLLGLEGSSIVRTVSSVRYPPLSPTHGASPKVTGVTGHRLPRRPRCPQALEGTVSSQLVERRVGVERLLLLRDGLARRGCSRRLRTRSRTGWSRCENPLTVG